MFVEEGKGGPLKIKGEQKAMGHNLYGSLKLLN